jgi:hypothetical protein
MVGLKIDVVSVVVGFLYTSISRCGVFGLCLDQESLCLHFLLVSG